MFFPAEKTNLSIFHLNQNQEFEKLIFLAISLRNGGREL